MENNSKPKETDKTEMSLNEQRIRDITLMYYSRPDVKKNIYEFSKNRECVPRYFESFGKRPDSFQYDNDILEQVKKGATSFHCSEELWHDPLEISTELSKEEFNNIRIGWDLLLDIDSPYIEYSKIYATILIDTLKFHGIENIGVKFSVSGNTDILVRMHNKINLLPISKVIELLKNKEKLEVLSLDSEKKLKFSKIYNFLEHIDDLFTILHSQSKVPLKATGHHSVFIWDKAEIIQKKVKEIKKGDYLISFNAEKNPFVKNNLEIINSFEFSKNQFIKRFYNNKVKITPELMRLIGYFLAEGHTTKIINQTGFSFNINEKNYISDCKKILFKLTKRKISIRNPNPGSTQILIHSKEWHDFFKNLCGEKKDKHVPEFSWSLSKELFLEMLRGYIRGDGYKIGKYSIVAKSVSKRLIKELVWLCKLNNISCTLSCEQNNPHKMPLGNEFKGSFVYIIKIPKSELSNLEFNRNRNKFSPFPRDKVLPIDGLKLVYKKIKPGMFNYHRSEQMTLRKKTANLKRIRKVLNWFSEFKTLELDEECRKIIKNYEKLFSSDISIVEVKNIVRSTKEKVYDVSVENTESFFGNDYPVLLHNSGSKGFHVIIPWKAFPKEIYKQKTKDMFPEWPRIICEYLSEIIKPKLEEEILGSSDLKDIAKRTGKKEEDLLIYECNSCKRPATKKDLITWFCPSCKNKLISIKKNKRIPKCPNEKCRKYMQEESSKTIFLCEYCNLNTEKNPEYFGTIKKIGLMGDRIISKNRYKTEAHIEADLILVSPRHLFRMPYSLHEKTSLSSIVIDKDKIKDFQITDARPLKVQIKEFYPDSKLDEARYLLLQALDWNEQKEKEEKKFQEKKDSSIVYSSGSRSKDKDYKEVKIQNPDESILPPCIKMILKGIKGDGKKRALFILINFFKSIGLNDSEIERRINEWNEKNSSKLKKGYIQSQLIWYKKNSTKVLPHNCKKPIYKDIGVCIPDTLCKIIKNPVSYTMKKFFRKDSI